MVMAIVEALGNNQTRLGGDKNGQPENDGKGKVIERCALLYFGSFHDAYCSGSDQKWHDKTRLAAADVPTAPLTKTHDHVPTSGNLQMSGRKRHGGGTGGSPATAHQEDLTAART